MENTLEAQILADALAGPELTEDTLGRASKLANEMIQLQADIEELNGLIEAKGQRLLHLSQKALPDLMREKGMKDFTLTDGSTVGIKTVYTGHIKDENRTAALKWLRDNGFGEMVKNEFKLAFGMSEDKRAQALAKRLEKAGYSYEQKVGVHPSTLNAFIREQTEAGKPVSEFLSPFIQDVAQVKRPKVKKEKR